MAGSRSGVSSSSAWTCSVVDHDSGPDEAALGSDGRVRLGGPTLFDGVRPESALAREEIFGPLLATVALAPERRDR